VEESVKSDGPVALSAARILVVEDSFFILMELESALLDAGAEAVWTCRTVREALSTLDGQAVAAAILDVQLDRETSAAVARRLDRQGVPFFFYTGQIDIAPVQTEWPECKVISKPASRQAIVDVVTDLLAR
jgi:DNA-binding NtrC family response regulator